MNGAEITTGLGAGQVFELEARTAVTRRDHDIGVVVIGTVVALLPAALESLRWFWRSGGGWDGDQAIERGVGSQPPVCAVLRVEFVLFEIYEKGDSVDIR